MDKQIQMDENFNKTTQKNWTLFSGYLFHQPIRFARASA